MPAVIPWSEDELQTLAANPNSRVFCEQKKIPVVLQPFHLQDLKSAVRDLLNASVNSFDRSLDGILLSYRHLRVLSKSASVAAETSGVVLEIQADFYVFRPEIGGVLQGVVNKKSNDHVGVLVYHRYNVSCPRPRSDERSERWLGNNVAMHQEVTIKLKEKNFSGKLPFFKGKIVAVGKVLSKSVSEAGMKHKKKKNQEGGAEPASLPETSDAIPSTLSKKNKRKLDDESDDKYFVEKSKKGIEDSSSKVSSMYNTLSSELIESSKKKKKRVSIGVTDERDFIPRLSLDVSQLPENLPPPNADSTHFDLAKILPSKSEKKKKKENPNVLSLVREESAEASGVSSKTQTHLHASSKSLLIGEEKGKKKKKDKKHSHEFDHSKDDPTLSLKATEFPSSFIPVSQGGASLKIHESPKKKKVPELPSKGQKSVKEAEIHNKKPIAEVSEEPAKKKKHKHQEIASHVEVASPTKERKSKKDKSANTLSQGNTGLQVSQGSYTSAIGQILNLKESVTSTKGKKKSKEEARNHSPTKSSQKKKDLQDAYENDCASDDTIPPGQRIVRESPLKLNAVGSSQRRESLSSSSIGKSPGTRYLASSSITDYDLGVKKGAIPVIFGNLDGRILPPPESPLKSPKKNVRKQESDSDSPQPKRVILSSSVPKQSSDSESDAGNTKYPVSSPSKKSKHSSRQSEDSSDSEYNAAVKNKLLQSMGVMQSPLKPAKHITKQDSTDSESESSADEKGKTNVYSRAQKVFPPSNENGAQTHPKSKKVDKLKNSPSKPSINLKSNVAQKTKVSQSTQAKDVLVSATGPEDSDSDLEIMKTALLQLEQEKLAGGPSKRSQRRKKRLQAEVLPKKIPASLEKAEEASKKTPSSPKKAVAITKNTALASKEKSPTNLAMRVGKSSSQKISTNDSDSDSGPDDRNTSALMQQMREKRAADENAKKSKAKAKQLKGPKEQPSATVSKSKKPKGNEKDIKTPSKAAKNTKDSGKADSQDGKKSKTKSNKKESNDELSDVIQRLMQQAKLNVGLK